VRFYSNSLSKENIAIGLIMISGGRLFFKFSDEKVEFVSKLNPSSSKLLSFSLSQIKNSLIEPTLHDKKIIVDDELFNLFYLDRLSKYNNGILQFDKPLLINQIYDEVKFNSFFEKYIAVKIEKNIEVKEINSVFINHIKTSFYDPLRDTIDVDKTIKKREIPSLYFNYHLDGLGVNGAIYTVKAIDLNSNKPLNQIQKVISEFESFNMHIDLFGKTKDINEKSKHYLVMDKYKGQKVSYLDLYSILTDKANAEFYKLVSTQDIGKIVQEIRKTKAKKFTKEFLASD
jgi:hypothetical protein